MITPEQRAAIDAARKDIVDTRQKLRAVQLELNRDISRLETEMRVFNIVLVPALLTVLAIVLGIVQRPARARGSRRMRAAHASACCSSCWAILAIAGGWYFGTATKPAEQTGRIDGGKLMFPDLAPKLKDAARMEITHQGKTTVHREARRRRWGLARSRRLSGAGNQAARHADRR